MFRTPRTTEATAGRRTLARVLAAAPAILITLSTGTPAGAISPTIARNHHLTLTIDYHVLEFNPRALLGHLPDCFDDADRGRAAQSLAVILDLHR